MHWAAVLAVTPVTPLPARAPVTTRVSSPTGDAQGSHCPCGFALRKGLQEGIRAVGILAHKGVGAAPLDRGGIGNVVEIVECWGTQGTFP